jgi:hypothetical protein
MSILILDSLYKRKEKFDLNKISCPLCGNQISIENPCKHLQLVGTEGKAIFQTKIIHKALIKAQKKNLRSFWEPENGTLSELYDDYVDGETLDDGLDLVIEMEDIKIPYVYFSINYFDEEENEDIKWSVVLKTNQKQKEELLKMKKNGLEKLIYKNLLNIKKPSYLIENSIEETMSF